MFLRFIKRFFCKHDYHLLTTFISSVSCYDVERNYVIYCPKCKRKKYVSKHDFDIIMKKQEIDRKYDENDNARSR